MSGGDPVREAYGQAQIVAQYSGETELQAPERALFDAWLRPGLRILDLGVGGGRTAPHLAAQASRYVGVDYSEAMVAACRERFPGLEFAKLDATDLRTFTDASFDAAVFSYNGIDALPTTEQRRRCLQECRRVLAPGGVLIFSDHNPRHLFFRPVLAGSAGLRRAWRLVYAGLHSASNLVFRLPRRAFWTGAGYLREPFTHHGGLRTYATTPARARRELQALGFELLQVLGAHHPRRSSPLATPWYYYAWRRMPDGAAP